MKLDLEEIKALLDDRTKVDKSKQASVCLVVENWQSGLWASKILFMVRSEDPSDHWAGNIGYPGGKKDPEDLDLKYTAEREFREEMGDELRSKSHFMGLLDSVQGRRAGQLMDFTIHPHVYFLTESLNLDPDPAEVGGYYWRSTSDLLDPKNKTIFNLNYRNVEVDLPGIHFPDKKVLWGLTYMITRDYFFRLGKHHFSSKRPAHEAKDYLTEQFPPYPG